MSLDVRRDGAATWITLDRPDALNALDDPVREALVDALREAAGDPGVRAVALTGGGRAFCVGQDLRELEQGYREGRAPDLAAVLERHYAPICRLLAEMPKPTVAVVNGVAAGAGVSLALACDLRLASSAARWRLAFSGIALIPDAGSTWHLPRLVGLSRAMEIALLGDWIDADQALQFGLVNRVWPADDFRREAEAAVAALAAGPTWPSPAPRRCSATTWRSTWPGARRRPRPRSPPARPRTTWRRHRLPGEAPPNFQGA